MPVSAYIVKASDGSIDHVVAQLEQLENARMGEVHSHSIPLSVYTETERDSRDVGALLDAMEGVEQSVLVYHNFEDVSEEERMRVPAGPLK